MRAATVSVGFGAPWIGSVFRPGPDRRPLDCGREYDAGVHPIEHLRYLAGARGIDDGSLVREAAYALSAMPDDPSMMVVVCRRLVERHERSAPLWWLCSSVLVSAEPSRTAWDLLQRVEMDPTLDHLVAAIGENSVVAVGRWTDSASALNAERADLDLVSAADRADISVTEAIAASTDQVLIDIADREIDLDTTANRRLVVCRLGTRLPDQVVAEIRDRSEGSLVSVRPSEFSEVVSSTGVYPTASSAALQPDGPFAPELLQRSVGP